jgi:hypothetical protein
MAKTTTRSKTRAKPRPEKVKKPLTPDGARHAVLACIRKPYRNAVSTPPQCPRDFLMIVKKKEQKKFFTDFLTRLKARDEELEKTDLLVSHILTCYDVS